MMRLSDAGWSGPQIAGHLHISEVRVRCWIKQFLTGGVDALPDQPHWGQHSQLTPEWLAAIRARVPQGDRPWTAAQLAAWVAAEYGVPLSPAWLCHLRRRARPLGVVLANYSVHKCAEVKAAFPALNAADIYLFSRPAYCPELSRIEAIGQDTNYHELPERSYDRVGLLKSAGDQGLTRKALQLREAHRPSALLLTAPA